MAKTGPLSGQKLGEKYLLSDLLGQGGFGAVYKASHILLNRQQAVKILLEHYFSNLEFRDRFIREAQTLATLDHPNIVHVDDFGFDENRAYLVMPYIGGGTLHDLLSKRSVPLDLYEVRHYLEDICAALEYAHKRQVVHLDLKPPNLLLAEDGRLLLSDFGLAHLLEQGVVKGGASLEFGTPQYTAPEHLAGQPGQRSDLYSLGVILYQMLAGCLPFEGSLLSLRYKHEHEEPPPLSNFRPDLPPEIEEVVKKALAKQPEERYQTPGELLAAFNAASDKRLQQSAESSGETRPLPISPLDDLPPLEDFEQFPSLGEMLKKARTALAVEPENAPEEVPVMPAAAQQPSPAPEAREADPAAADEGVARAESVSPDGIFSIRQKPARRQDMLVIFCRVLALLAAALALVSFFFLSWLDVSSYSQYGSTTVAHLLLTGFDLARNTGPALLLWLAPANAVLLLIFALLPYHLLRAYIYARQWKTLLIVVIPLSPIALLVSFFRLLSIGALYDSGQYSLAGLDIGLWLGAASLVLGAVAVCVDILQAGLA
jgi:serine/threonine protein kinase